MRDAPLFRRADASTGAVRGNNITRGTAMKHETHVTRAELPCDAPAIETMQRLAFGPGAYARAAFRVREQAPHLPELSFVTERDGELIASVRLTPIAVGERHGLLLGPLVVDPAYKNQGFGKALMRLSVDEARNAGWRFIILVGDQPYYWPFGFRPLPRGTVQMPGPVDPERLLVAELSPGAAEALAGVVRGVDHAEPVTCPAIAAHRRPP
jgi:predicted N-acetyltransferase YhbS